MRRGRARQREVIKAPKAFRAATALLAASPLGGCAASPGSASAASIPATASSELWALGQRAWAGDKQAQLDLGIAYEEGRGLPVDLRRARRLYRRAATTSGGTLWVYMPSPGAGAPGGMIAIDRGPLQPGLPEAMRRYRHLSGRQ